MRKPLRIAVIGTGAWGTCIIETLQSIPKCVVVATATRNYRELILRHDLDGIVIATPAITHAAIAINCLNAGIPIFVEKPFAATLRDAKRVFRTAQKRNLPVFVGHIHCHSPAFLAVKKNLRRIGTITSISAEGCGTDISRMDINALWDWGPHSFAMMIDALGATPRRIRVLTTPKKTSSDVSLAFSFPGNISGTALFSWHAPEKRQRLVIIGSKGTLTYDAYAEQKATLTNGKTNAVVALQYSNTPPLTAELATWLTSLRTTGIDHVQESVTLGVIKTLERARALSKKPHTRNRP